MGTIAVVTTLSQGEWAETADPAGAIAALNRLLAVTAAAFEERAQLRHALETRVVIEQAKGILAERLGLSLDDAFAVLRTAARSSRVRIHELARTVVEEPGTPREVIRALGSRRRLG
jgi:AmiR/NasT family two-component response regulator